MTRHAVLAVPTSDRPTDARPPIAGRLVGVQALRAVAAMLVVAMHAVHTWHLRFASAQDDFWHGGAAGVDIFFVISGFVMMVSTRTPAQRDWRRFALHRIVRIAPPYWLATAAKAAGVLAAPSLVLRSTIAPAAVLASLLLVAWPNGDGEIRPLLPVAWTLFLEAAFYAVCALALACRAGLVRFVVPILVAAVLGGQLIAPNVTLAAFYCDPIVLELGAGLCLGAASLRGWLLPRPLAGAAAILGMAAIILAPPTLPRLVSWGMPALAVVAGTVALEPWLRDRSPRWLARLGDASYAIYLTHGLVLPACAFAMARAGSRSMAVLFVLGIGASAAFGLLAHDRVERPVVRWAGRRLGLR